MPPIQAAARPKFRRIGPILGPKENFLGVSFPYCDIARAKFVVVPVAYEATTSYRKGTRFGPLKLLEASRQLEFYDEELGYETVFRSGIATLPILKPKARLIGNNFLAPVSTVVRELARKGKSVITVGGEHTITAACIDAMKGISGDLSILWVDAHADLRQSYERTPWNHACALRRSLETCRRDKQKTRVALIGVRNLDIEEVRYIKTNRNIALFGADKCSQLRSSIGQIVKHLSPHVYVSIDLDGFDPSVMPGVGTPQPGGIFWDDMLALLRAVFKKKNVVGADIMELAPINGQVVSEFAAAKLLYRIMGYWQR